MKLKKITKQNKQKNRNPEEGGRFVAIVCDTMCCNSVVFSVLILIPRTVHLYEARESRWDFWACFLYESTYLTSTTVDLLTVDEWPEMFRVDPERCKQL